ncbi:MSCRAMM family protein [Archangium lansingense]|uniref:Carboxypeptidase-like regulatory domain-containing protein n=1 Tax=Archangium lansingense TaxID=2995310 RepID=A0ABT4AD03_9BACT|nr:carboxypeptidase-like regulatory domain-containing protein [Archangium lansinium]MCY1079547.1 carboxypeptidase-like regulatory domain-containing protein [Archangium lansinium]
MSRLLAALVVGVLALGVSGCAHDAGVPPPAETASQRTAEAPREPLPSGPLILRGVVTWEGKPVGGVTVSAVPHADVPLSARTCSSGTPGMTILDPGCGAMKGELAQTADWLGRKAPLARTVSGADGWFEFNHLRASTYDLWAVGPKGTAFVAAVPAGANVARVPLEAGRSIRVSVEDGSSGRPLPDAQVALLPRVGGQAFLAVSDAGGEVLFPQVPTGEYHAVASFLGRLAEAGPVDGDGTSLRLHVPRSLSGQVLRAGREGEAGLRVRLEGERYQGLTQTREEGRFHMTGLPPGSYSLVVREGRELATVTAHLPEDRDVTDVRLSLVPCSEVAGRVSRPNGDSLSGAEVELLLGREGLWRRTLATTSVEGRFRFECVEQGQVKLSVKARGHISPLEPLAGELSPGASLPADFTLPPAAPARGRIVEPGGRGVGGVRIVLSPLDGRGGAVRAGGSTTTAEDGSFEVDGLAPGRYAYELSPDERFQGARGEVRLPATNLRLRVVRGPAPEDVRP